MLEWHMELKKEIENSTKAGDFNTPWSMNNGTTTQKNQQECGKISKNVKT